jgi:hypothetical protein
MKVEVIVNGTIAAAAQQLTITPTTDTLPAMQVGVALPPTPIASVTGGVPPYTYATDTSMQGGVDPATQGLNLAEDGNGNISISGTPTVAGAVLFGVAVTDTAGAVAAVKVGGAAETKPAETKPIASA